jgi:UDP-3-O-[3-hydroxymyristoyl] glucosamine N-acyltransferase
VKIGDDAIAMGMSGIAGNIAPRSLVMGAPAKPRDSYIQQMFMMGRLKGLFEKVERLAGLLDATSKKEKD